MLYALIITDLCCSCVQIQINSVMLIYKHSEKVKPCKTAGFLQHKLKTDTINKKVVSLSWLNVKKIQDIKQDCILPEGFSISLRDLKRACCTVKIRWTMRASWLACRNKDIRHADNILYNMYTARLPQPEGSFIPIQSLYYIMRWSTYKYLMLISDTIMTF